MQHNILKVDWSKPCEFVKFEPKLEHVNINKENRKYKELKVTFQLKFTVEVNLSKQEYLENMPSKKVSDSPRQFLVVLSSHYQC